MASAAGIPESDLPILSEENIVHCVKDYINVPFSTAELRQPTPEKLLTIYGTFVCTVIQVSNEQITQIPLHVMEAIAHQDLYIQDGAGLMLFAKSVAYFMERCGIRDFTLNDIFNPTKKRTRKLLSAVVNFTQFAGSYCDPTRSEIISAIEESKIKQEHYKRKKDELPGKIAKLKSLRLERQKAVPELNLIGLKAQYDELESVKKEKVINNTNTEAEVEELRNLLTIARSKRSIDDGQALVDTLQARTSAMLIKEDLVVKQNEEVTPSALKLIHDIEQEAGKYQVLAKDLEKLKDHSSEISKDIKAILAEKQNVEYLIKTKLDKKERLTARCNEFDKFVKDTEHRLSNKKLIVLEDIQNKEGQGCKLREEMNQIHQLMLLYGEEHDVIMKTLTDKMNILKSKLSEYNSKIINAYQ